MKKTIVSLSMLLAVTATGFSKPLPEPGHRVLEGFRKEFPSVQQVSWTSQADYEKAVFVLGGRRVVAWFSKDGQYEGSIRDIFFDQLPLTVMSAVEKKYPQGEILDVREINNAEGTHYKVRLVVKEKRVSMKIGADGNIDDIERLAK